jgi:radical SAM superfamily enzyme with C-terminal helix-hairpin-helix motif
MIALIFNKVLDMVGGEVMVSQNKGKKDSRTSTKKNKSSIFDFVQESNIEIIVAVLLLTGKLRFDSLQLYREASLIINLVGKYETLVNLNGKDIDQMLNLFNDKDKTTLKSIVDNFKQFTDN